jgi:Peptidase A4 family
MKKLIFTYAFLALGLWSADTSPISPSAHQHDPMKLRERHGSNVTSTNWSGYAVTGPNGSVSDVTGTWTVPALPSCSAATQYSSFWIGIDGYDSNTVEQIGTDSDCVNGTPTYYAWFEFYPHLSYTINKFPVNPGDLISAEVKYSGGTFTVSLTNHMSGLSFSTSTKMNNAKRSSAEWIAEAPSAGGVLPLADFVSVNFGPGDTATIGGPAMTIGSFPAANVFEITMTNSSGVPEATPTGLTNNDKFTVNYDLAGNTILK